MKVTFDWTRVKSKIAEDVSGCRDPRCLLFLASEAEHLMNPYGFVSECQRPCGRGSWSSGV